MDMTLAQFNGFMAALRRDDRQRFAAAAAAARVGAAEGKHYKQFMDDLENDTD